MNYAAERKLLFSLKGDDMRRELTVRLGVPYTVRQDMVQFPIPKDGCSGCKIEIFGIDEVYPDVYGADSLQAIELALRSIDGILSRLRKNYDLYFLSGEPYFEA